MLVTFTGRKHYLVEKGPAVVALWTRTQGCIFKCGHGPAAGMFSKKNFNVINAYMDHFGLVAVQETPKRIANKLLRKLYFLAVRPQSGVTLQPRFLPVRIEMQKERLQLSVDNPRAEKCCMVLPLLGGDARKIRVTAGGQERALHRIGQAETQYGMADLYATQPYDCGHWKADFREEDVCR